MVVIVACCNQVTEWTRKIRKEMLALDRQIRGKPVIYPKASLVVCWSWSLMNLNISGIQREEEKIKRSLKDAAKKGDKDVCIVYAKELVRSKRAISKIHTSKAHLNSIQMHMKEQLCKQHLLLEFAITCWILSNSYFLSAVLKTAGALQKSTQVMTSLQALFKIPEMNAAMREMSKEMMKAGIIEEMIQDTFDSLEDTEELEQEAEEEIQNVIYKF